jgi:hypothetical protein
VCFKLAWQDVGRGGKALETPLVRMIGTLYIHISQCFTHDFYGVLATLDTAFVLNVCGAYTLASTCVAYLSWLTDELQRYGLQHSDAEVSLQVVPPQARDAECSDVVLESMR